MNEFINSFKNIITNPSLIKNLDSVSKFLGTKSAYIEKDLWITLVLYYLFQIDSERHLYSFKGGTSLSKAFGLINRFSEDLDIYIDKTKFGYTNEYILKDLTRSKFKSFKEDLDFETEKFIKNTFILRLVNFIKSNFSEFKLEIEREYGCIFNL